MRADTSLKKLRAGKVLNLDGILLKMDEDEIREGDLYVAERNTGPKLLVAKKVDRDRGWIEPTSTDYSFDLHECVKVCEA